MKEKQFYTIRELCEADAFPYTSRKSIARLVREGKLEAIKVSARKTLITKQSADDYMENLLTK